MPLRAEIRAYEGPYERVGLSDLKISGEQFF